MAHPTSPTVRRRRLASELRRLRESARLTCDDVGERLGCTGSRISRIETGRLGIRPGDVREMLDLYDVTGAEADRLIQLARDARQRGWWQAYNDVLTEEFKTFVGLEAEASSILDYEAHYVPGLLQTQAYARELFRVWRPSVDPSKVDRLTAVRMERQELLRGPNAPDLWVVIDETILRRNVGGPAVMREQLDRLLAASEYPNVTIQVVPFDAGAYVAMGSAFIVFEFPDALDESVAYMENLARGLYLEDKDEVAACTLAFNHLRAAALPDHESTALITEVAKGL